MELRIICNQCSAEYRVSDEKLQENAKRFSCKRCDQEIILKPGPDGVEATGGSIKSPFAAEFKSRFGNFSDLKRMASGGMGDIYLAKLGGAEGFEREVVLKVLHPHLARDDSFAKAMVDEAKLTVLLHHPNIVQMYNLEKSGELLYCVMEYVPGKSLAVVQRAYRKKGATIPVQMAVYIAIESLAGLAHAHDMTDRNGKSLGIVHRDISPQNLLVTKEGWVKIIDFGIAKAATRMTQTAPGMIKGKFAYMAPEQFKGASDHRVDLFAMGVVLWETLAGVRLFHSSTDVDTLHKVLHMDPPPISLTRSEIPKELDAILKKSMTKDPNQRFGSAQEFRSELLRFISPATPEDLRAAVDIEAEGVEEMDESVKTRADAAFRDITPVVEQGLTQAYPALDQPYKRRRARKILWTALAFVLLAGLGAGVYWGLPLLKSNDSPTPDAGALLPAVDAGVVAQAKDAGLVAKPADTGVKQSKDEGKKKPEPRVAQVRKIPTRKPPRKPKVIKLTRRGVEKILRRNGGRLQGCADTHLPRHGGGADVSLVLGFTIMSSGKVEKANLKPVKLESTPFGKCMLARVRKIKFPRHLEKSVTVSFPLKFQAIKR
jgi:predicted Zn finger-like uncharacterized protein